MGSNFVVTLRRGVKFFYLTKTASLGQIIVLQRSLIHLILFQSYEGAQVSMVVSNNSVTIDLLRSEILNLKKILIALIENQDNELSDSSGVCVCYTNIGSRVYLVEYLTYQRPQGNGGRGSKTLNHHRVEPHCRDSDLE